ncbi:hypothetical protein JMJ77_0010587 [Colletotrichum scovillei]|uniref:Uncharacterized protein n=1 Tax=Colletotrichum scovillei TaxID=1209932 RepID=A0A9P7R2D4_9PEZI|nr:hypothetical protein JMJ77_0010587 [Colletotrichum scovillei]KAG7059553.1 hypothetical protein JMJ78_0014844 [Colletotrichum scovillei]KAG7066999.1 hypothetical protein JMJ76_0008444 [Colletotrichum scovillei]
MLTGDTHQTLRKHKHNLLSAIIYATQMQEECSLNTGFQQRKRLVAISTDLELAPPPSGSSSTTVHEEAVQWAYGRRGNPVPSDLGSRSSPTSRCKDDVEAASVPCQFLCTNSVMVWASQAEVAAQNCTAHSAKDWARRRHNETAELDVHSSRQPKATMPGWADECANYLPMESNTYLGSYASMAEAAKQGALV